jgi:aspartate/methionine/tyrosine aminotransferase
MHHRNDDVSSYMEWAKLNSAAPYNLASSGVLDYPLAELGIRAPELANGGTSPYGYPPLIERLAAKTKVPEECLVSTIGTSMANYLALSTLVERGDEVLVEKPTYDPLLAILHHLGARVLRFERRFEKGFRIGLGELERRITPTTRLIVTCNLHNPSSALTGEESMVRIGEMAAAVGARVLVDEVYLEALFDEPWRSAFHLGPNFVVTSSLTKAYGLSGIRCGWILAEPAVTRRMWQLVDITYGIAAHPAEQMAVAALDELDRLRARARGLLAINRELVNEFLAGRQDLQCEPSRHGTTVFPRLGAGRVTDFVELLRTSFETSVVPGEFFEAPQHFRLGFCGTTEALRGGLERLGDALDAFKSTQD